jgi:hypothetical protein
MGQWIRPSDTWREAFTLRAASGAATNADSAPTATMYRNGVADALAVAVSNVATGAYALSASPAAYSAGDNVRALVSVIVSGVAWVFWTEGTTLVGFPAAGPLPATDGSGNALATAAALSSETTAIESAITSATSPLATAAALSSDAAAIESAISALAPEVTGSGAGPVAINQNTGGADNLRYVNISGEGIGEANILIYLATDWPGNPGNVQAAAVTGSDGRWLAPAYVSHGTYVAVFTKIGLDGPDVSAPFTV